MGLLHYPKPPRPINKKKSSPLRKRHTRATMNTRIVKIKEWEGGWVVLDANISGRSRLSIKYHDVEDGPTTIEIPVFDDEFKTLLKALNSVYREAVRERKARKLREKIERNDTEEVGEGPSWYVGNPAYKSLAQAMAAQKRKRKR